MIIVVLSGCDFDADQVLLEKRQKDEECRSCKTVPNPKKLFQIHVIKCQNHHRK